MANSPFYNYIGVEYIPVALNFSGYLFFFWIMAKSTANRRLGKAATSATPAQPSLVQTPLPNPKTVQRGSLSQQTQDRSRAFQRAVSYLLYGLLLASLFTPLIFSSTSFFGFVSERGLFFRVIVAVMAIVSLLKPGFLTLSWSWLQVSVPLFLVVIGLADVLGVDAGLSLLSGFMRMEGFVGYLHLGLYALVLARADFSARQWDGAFLTSVAVSLLVFLLGYFSTTGWLSDGYRFVATVGQPTFLAIYWLIHIFLAAYLAVKINYIPPIWRILGVSAVFIILLWGLVLTGARSAMLGLLTGGAAVGLGWVWQRYRSIPGMVGIVAGTLGLAAGGYWLARYTMIFRGIPGVGRILDITGGNNTLPARQITNQIAIRSFWDRPLLGWGQENYAYAFPRHYDPALIVGNGSEWYDRVHCVPLEWACSTGILGLLAYGCIWYWFMRGVMRLPVSISPILVGLAVAYFVFGLLNPDNLLASQFFFLLIGFVAAAQPTPTAAFSLAKSTSRLAVGTAWIVVSLWLIYLTLNAYQTLRQLDKQVAMTNGFERMNFLRTCYEQSLTGRYEVADAVESFAISVLQEQNSPPEAKQFCYEQALLVMNDQLREHSGYGRLLLRISSLHLAAGKYDKAVDAIQQAIAIDGEKRPATLMLLGEAYLFQRDYPAALSAFKRAQQAQPRWQVPLINQAQVAAFQHDTTQINQLIGRIDTRTFIENLAAVKQVYQTANYLPGFVARIAAVPYADRFMFNRPIYQEWALTAFDLNDLYQLETALCDFDVHFSDYHTLFTTAEINQLIAETHRGVRPDRLVEIAARLPVNDGVPEW